MVKIIVPAGWAHQGRKEFEGEPGALPDVIKAFATANPGYRRRLLDADGELLGYFNIYLDDELVPRSRRTETTVAPDATIALAPPLTGG